MGLGVTLLEMTEMTLNGSGKDEPGGELFVGEY